MEIVFNILKKYYKEIIIGILVIALGLLTYLYFNNKASDKLDTTNTSIIAVAEEEIVPADKIFIDIKGEVKKPGVYEVANGSIVQDVISLAGGLTKSATTKNLNLSKAVSAEMVIIVANKKTLEKTLVATTNICKCEDVDITECINNEETSVVSPTEGETSAAEETTTKISINSGTKEELMTLSGIGESKANNIIAFREANGDFKSLEEIMNVTGIGESIFAQIKESITL